MTFHDYLTKTALIAKEEQSVLNFLHDKDFDRIAVRAAKSSLQVMIENAIGKAKKILKHYNCTIIPNESRDSLKILHDCAAIDDEMYRALHSAIGFRNAMIHDYMSFNQEVLITLVKEKKYTMIFNFLLDECNYSNLICKRIENYAF